jgi:hypothetical protein
MRQRGAQGRACLYYRAAPCLDQATDSLERSSAPQDNSEVHRFSRFLEVNHHARRGAEIVLGLMVGSSFGKPRH